MKEIKCRDLRAEELECRVGSVKEGKGFSLLLYKTARADMTLLDETFGEMNWQCKYYQVKNTMICCISIWDNEKQQWIEKCDGGDDDFNAEKVKGECSDAFKRAGFRVLPSTRKLYNSPFIWINEDSNNNKFQKYEVAEIGYDETSVTKLAIKNSKTNQLVYSYGLGVKVPTQAQKEPKNTNYDNSGNVSMKELNASVTDMGEVNEDYTYIFEYYNGLTEEKKERFSAWLFDVIKETNIDKLTKEQASRVANTLRKASGK